MGFGLTVAGLEELYMMELAINISNDLGSDYRIRTNELIRPAHTSRSQIPALKVMIGAIDMVGGKSDEETSKYMRALSLDKAHSRTGTSDGGEVVEGCREKLPRIRQFLFVVSS